jgi:putative PEP-CTERM system histidine kinase
VDSWCCATTTGNFNLQASWPSAHTAPLVCELRGDDALPRFCSSGNGSWTCVNMLNTRRVTATCDCRAGCRRRGRRVIAPLLVGNHLLGFLVLRAPPEPFTMNFEDRDLLKTVGRNVAVQLAQRQADESLAQSRQFDAYNRFAAFVMHDLKNCVAQLQLLLANAERHRSNPVFVDDAIGTIRNSTERMTRLIEQLQSREVHGTARVVDLAAIAQSAVLRSEARQPAVRYEGGAARLPVRADPDRLSAVIDHVIRNAQDATPEPGRVTVSLKSREGMAHLRVVDDGMGMDEDFVRNRLFKPFDTTKGAKGMGIGAFQTREYIRSLGGDVEVQSAPGRGTDFSIRLVLCETSNQDS